MGNQHGALPADEIARHQKNPRSNVTIPHSRHNFRAGSSPNNRTGTSDGSELEWATPPSSPFKNHSLRAAFSPSVIFATATALPHVASPSSEFESTTDVPIRQSTHVWRRQGTSDGEEAALSGSSASFHQALHASGSDHEHVSTTAALPSQAEIKFRAREQVTETFNSQDAARRCHTRGQLRHLKQEGASGYDGDKQIHETESSSTDTTGYPVLASEIHLTNTRFLSSPDPSSGISGGSEKGKDAQMMTSRSNYPESVIPSLGGQRRRDWNSTADRSNISPTVEPVVGLQMLNSSPLHLQLKHASLNRKIPQTDDVTHSQGTFTSSSTLQQSLSTPVAPVPSTTESSEVHTSLSPSTQNQNFYPTSPPTGVYKSVSPPINLHQPSKSLVPDTHKSYSSHAQQLNAPPSFSDVHLDSVSRGKIPSSSSSSESLFLPSRRPGSSKDQQEMQSARTAVDHEFQGRPFSSSAVFNQQNPASPSKSTHQQQSTSSRSDSDSWHHHRSSKEQLNPYKVTPSSANQTQSPGEVGEVNSRQKNSLQNLRLDVHDAGKVLSSKREVFTEEAGKCIRQSATDATWHRSNQGDQSVDWNQTGSEHPKRSLSASSRRADSLEGHLSSPSLRSRTRESDRQELGMVREGMPYTSIPTFAGLDGTGSRTLHSQTSSTVSSPLVQFQDKTEFSSSVSLPASCSAQAMSPAAAEIEEFQGQLTESSRNTSVESDLSISDGLYYQGQQQQQQQQKQQQQQQHKHVLQLSSSASELSALEERRRRRAALVRSRARNAPPSTVEESVHETEEKRQTTMISDLQQGKGTNRTTENTASLSGDSNSNSMPDQGKVSGLALSSSGQTKDSCSSSESTDPMTISAAKDVTESQKEQTFVKAEERRQFNCSDSGGNKNDLALKESERKKMPPLNDEEKTLDSLVSDKQPPTDQGSKHIIEDTVIVHLVEVTNAGHLHQLECQNEDGPGANRQRGPAENNSAYKPRAAQYLTTERVEFEVEETLVPPLLDERVFVTAVEDSAMESILPRCQAFCFLLNRWMIKPPVDLSTERVEYEIKEEFLLPPSHFQQAFVGDVQGRALECLATDFSAHEKVLVQFTRSSLAPKPTPSEDSRKFETSLAAMSSEGRESKQRQKIADSIPQVNTTRSNEFKTAALLCKEKNGSEAHILDSQVKSLADSRAADVHKVSRKDKSMPVSSNKLFARQQTLQADTLLYTRAASEHKSNIPSAINSTVTHNVPQPERKALPAPFQESTVMRSEVPAKLVSAGIPDKTNNQHPEISAHPMRNIVEVQAPKQGLSSGVGIMAPEKTELKVTTPQMNITSMKKTSTPPISVSQGQENAELKVATPQTNLTSMKKTSTPPMSGSQGQEKKEVQGQSENIASGFIGSIVAVTTEADRLCSQTLSITPTISPLNSQMTSNTTISNNTVLPKAISSESKTSSSFQPLNAVASTSMPPNTTTLSRSSDFKLPSGTSARIDKLPTTIKPLDNKPPLIQEPLDSKISSAKKSSDSKMSLTPFSQDSKVSSSSASTSNFKTPPVSKPQDLEVSSAAKSLNVDLQTSSSTNQLESEISPHTRLIGTDIPAGKQPLESQQPSTPRPRDLQPLLYDSTVKQGVPLSPPSICNQTQPSAVPPKVARDAAGHLAHLDSGVREESSAVKELKATTTVSPYNSRQTEASKSTNGQVLHPQKELESKETSEQRGLSRDKEGTQMKRPPNQALMEKPAASQLAMVTPTTQSTPSAPKKQQEFNVSSPSSLPLKTRQVMSMGKSLDSSDASAEHDAAEAATTSMASSSPSHKRPVVQKAKTIDIPESQLKSRKDNDDEDDDDDEDMFHLIVKRGPRKQEEPTESAIKRISVAERIFKMESKASSVEEDSPRSSTEVSTPVKIQSLFRDKPNLESQQRKKSFSDAHEENDSGASKSDQMQSSIKSHLSTIAAAADKSSADRSTESLECHSTQSTLRASRRITQPITCDEIKTAERMESVSTFRAEVLRKAAISLYGEPLNKPERQLTVKIKGQETFPEPFERDRSLDGHRNQRYKTVPVTSHELYDIPEANGSSFKQSLDEQSDYGRRYGDDEGLYGSHKEGSPSERKQQVMRSELGARTWETRPLCRSMHSLDEEQTNEEYAEDEWRMDNSEIFYQKTTNNRSKNDKNKAETEDELCKLSLAEKMKIFSDKTEADATSSQPTPSGARRKQRRLQSRFKTQSLDEEPITTEEVGKARVSPLAMSLVKPPPVDALRSLPLKEQREFMAQWAEMTLTQSSSSNSSVFPSSVSSAQAQSVDEDSAEEKKKGILKPVSETLNRKPVNQQLKGILKSNTSQEVKLKGILKADNAPGNADRVKTSGILKNQNLEAEEVTRKGLQTEDSTLDSVHRVLKKQSSVDVRTSKDDITSEDLRQESSSAILRSFEFTSSGNQQFETSKQSAEDSSMLKTTLSSSLTVAKVAETGSDSSSASSDLTLGSKIKNRAVARRRQQMQRQLDGRPQTPPAEESESSQAGLREQEEEEEEEEEEEDSLALAGDQRPLKYGRKGRHFTQPITPGEKEEVESGGKIQIDDVRASPSYLRLAERVSALQKSGETDWKRRLEGMREDSPEDVSLLQEKEMESRSRLRPSSIAARLSLLHSAQDMWKEKVEEKDIKQFTVEGKMSRLGVAVDSPLQQRPRKPGKPTITRALSSPNLSVSPDGVLEDNETDHGAPVRVMVPVIDDKAIARFFSLLSHRGPCLNVSTRDFDDISRKARTLRISTRNVKSLRTREGSRNPLRATFEHPGFLQSHYNQVKTGVAQQELKRIKHEQILGTTHLAQEALAGLASKENFSNVMLRKTDSSTTAGDKHQPFCEVMLLQVKGRRYCQTRLVELRSSSVNSGDCFILVTPDTVYLWVGEYCNVIEKAKATDVANQIHQKRDLGIKSTCSLITIPEEYQDVIAETRLFWKTLEEEREEAADSIKCCAQPPGAHNEDELYEAYISDTNAVYRIKDERLQKVEEFSGKVLKYEMLRSKDAYVFDFGGEMYVWTGKHVPFNKRKKIVQLALELWNTGYNYSDYEINPLAPLATGVSGCLPVQGTERPAWCVFGKVNQNMETVLFKEKFTDWPDSSRVIQVKGQVPPGNDSKMEAVLDLKPYDAKLIIPIDTTPVSMVLEGSHLGRGCHWEGFEKGIRREVDILTQGIDIWHVMEFDHYLLDEESHGQLHDGDTYVIRWHYVIAQKGSRSLRSDSLLGGRIRCAYFFWQGRNSSINEKGASALMTVELDEERGPQIRVVQGKESPCFLRLFQGRMIVHIGKREEESTNTAGPWKFYMVRNELPNEAYLLEIPLGVGQLRSRGSFILLNLNTGLLFLWHGNKTTNSTVLRAREIVLTIRERCPAEVGLRTEETIMPIEMLEGSEHAGIWDALQSDNGSIYDTLVQDPRAYNFSPRLFLLSSVSGIFEATELVNPARSNDAISPFPFLQSDMYNASQPALFLLDNHHEVYLWQGWWPLGTEEADNIRTASAETRFLSNRRCAMQTALHYCREINPSNPPPAYLVYAGLEPVVFTNIFPVWESSETITQAMLNEGKVGDDLDLVEDVLAKLTDVQYTWEELQRWPLPDGVDPLRLEVYISQEEFEEIMGMSREEFSSLPAWKQVNIKKEVGLF